MSTRIYVILHTTKPQIYLAEIMQYPLSYIVEEEENSYGYDLKNIQREILVESEEEQASAGTFPKNIKEYFWVRCGENDGDDWIACGLLENGAYFLFEGGCDYTGFDCQGHMCLWVSKKWENIIDHAMSEKTYSLYLKLDEVDEAHRGTRYNPEQEEDYEEFRGWCAHCKEEYGTMYNDVSDEGGYLCADCFWDLDKEMKRRRCIERLTESPTTTSQ